MAQASGKPFLEREPAERVNFVKQWLVVALSKEHGDDKPFILMARELTLLGYFTSKVGIDRQYGVRSRSDGVPRVCAVVADEETRLLGMNSFTGSPPMTVDSRIIDLYNEYVHTALPRREFLARLAQIAGGVAAATSVLAVLEPNYAQARQVEPDDKRLKTEKIEFNGPNGPVKAYVAQPKKLGKHEKLPGVLVIHENRGLNEHIEDVARRTALAGYVAIAPGRSVGGGRCAGGPGSRA